MRRRRTSPKVTKLPVTPADPPRVPRAPCWTARPSPKRAGWKGSAKIGPPGSTGRSSRPAGEDVVLREDWLSEVRSDVTCMAVVAAVVVAQKFLPARATIDVPLALAVVGLGIVILAAPSAIPGLVPAVGPAPSM